MVELFGRSERALFLTAIIYITVRTSLLYTRPTLIIFNFVVELFGRSERVSPFSHSWSHLLSAVQVHTTTQCMFYREQLGPTPPKAGHGRVKSQYKTNLV